MTPVPRSTSRGSAWLALVGTLYLCFGLAYLAVVPPFEGHDVHAHFAAVQYFRTHRGLPTIDSETLRRSFELVTQPPLYHVLAAAAATGWPLEPASRSASDSVNPYFGGGVTYRQSETLADQPASALAPAQMARLVSFLGGFLALLGTWWLARLIVPERPSFAAAAAAIAALNPYFLFLATTITNDALVAGLCALALAAGFTATLRARRPNWWFVVGAAYGLAAVTKYSALLLALPLGVLWLQDARRRGWRTAGTSLAFGAAGFALTAGWWFARDVWLYREIVPFRQMAIVVPVLNRDPPWPIARTLAHVPWLISSFWGVFVALIAPAPYLAVTRAFLLAGLGSAAIAIARSVRARDASTAAALGVLALWLAVVAAAVLYWTRTVSYGEQARLGFIGASAFGVLMAAGWVAWLPRRRQALGDAALVGFMACLAAWLVPFLHRAYALPPPIASSARPDRLLDARFAPGMRVVGVDFPAGAAIAAGGTMPVRVYLTADAPIGADYTVFVHLSDAADRLLYGYDGAPAGGRHPTRQWVPGQIFVDEYAVTPTSAITTDALASLSLGFYPFEQPDRRIEVVDGARRAIGDRVVLGKVRLGAGPGSGAAQNTSATGDGPAERTPSPTPVATWRNGISLVSADVERDDRGRPAGVDLTWTTTRTLQSDYTVFAQVLDGDNGILAQVDRQPRDGDWPTSTWRPGDVVTDSLRWSGDLGDWRRLIVGLYGADGQRLPLARPGATFADAVDLVTRP